LTTDVNGKYFQQGVPVGTVIAIIEGSLPRFVQTVGTNPTTVNVPVSAAATDLDGYYFPTDTPTKSPVASPARTAAGFWDTSPPPSSSPSDPPSELPTASPTVSPSKSPTKSPTAGLTPAPPTAGATAAPPTAGVTVAPPLQRLELLLRRPQV
jgi:hypothetical protein